MKFRELEVARVALAYAVVERESLAPSPVAERVLGADGALVLGPVTCAKGSAPHVLELATNGRVASLAGLVEPFQAAVRELFARLEPHGATLLPDTYARRPPHGLHLAVSFRNDAELARLQLGLRVLLPIVPALCASSPTAEPLPAGTRAATESALELPALDVAECPAADLAIAQAVVSAVQGLCAGELSSRADQERLSADALSAIAHDVIRNGERAQIRDKQFLRALGFPREVSDEPTARDLWSHLIEATLGDRPDHLLTRARLDVIQREGPLARRILGAAAATDVRSSYFRLARCLSEGRAFRQA